MTIRPNIVLAKGFVPLPADVLEDEENLAVVGRSYVKEEHGLVPRRHFRAWHIVALGPCVGLALDNHLLFSISKIEVVGFAPTNANVQHEARSQV